MICGKTDTIEIQQGNPVVIELTLEDIDGKTRMILQHCGLPEGEMLELTKAGWNESFDKLEAILT